MSSRQPLNGSMYERFAHQDDVNRLVDSMQKLELHLERSSSMQQIMASQLEKLTEKVEMLIDEKKQKDTIWNLVKKLWKNAPWVLGVIFISVALMTDGSFHLSKLISDYYKIKAGNL